jgi:hypothetical protein
MKPTREIPWKRIAVEATAIVASILIAFAIDAWWQDRSERIVESQHLRALHEDLVISLKILDEDEAYQQQQVAYLELLLLANSETPFSDELRQWIDDGLWQIGSYEPQLSSLRELESSGQSGIIRNQDIRRSLASVRQRLDGLEVVQRDFQISQQNLIDRFLVDNFDLSRLLLDPTPGYEPDLSMLGTDEFRSRVAFKISLRREVSQVQAQVRSIFAETIELINRELQGIE